MRGGPGKHTAPEHTQPEPDDNTSVYVQGQIGEWRHTRVPVHPETAREIAAWFQAPGGAGYPFAVFASTGGVVDGLIDAIRREQAAIVAAEREDDAALAALLAYAEAASWCDSQTGTALARVTCGQRAEPGMAWCSDHNGQSRVNFPGYALPTR